MSKSDIRNLIDIAISRNISGFASEMLGHHQSSQIDYLNELDDETLSQIVRQYWRE